jgi:hypothetical protein
MCKKSRKFQIDVAIVFPLGNENLNTFLTRLGNYLREETIRGNTVGKLISMAPNF